MKKSDAEPVPGDNRGIRHAARQLGSEFGRFLVVGGTTTALSYVVYLVLIRWMSYEVAYSIGYALGLVVSYVLSTRYVFRKSMSAATAMRFPLVYLAQYLVGLLVLRVAIETFNVPKPIAPAIAVIATIPVTFLLSRKVVRRT